MTFQYLGLEYVVPSKTNPRKRFPEAQLAELADNIRQHGVLQPILVRPIDAYGTATMGGESVNGRKAVKYEIIAGECRYRASRLAEQPGIPAIIREMHDLEALQLQVFENLHRNDLHPMEEAEGFQQLLRKANHMLGMTADELGAKVGKSRAYIYASLKLLALCPAAREAFFEGKLTQSTALLIARIPGEKLQMQALEEITKPTYSGDLPAYRVAAKTIQDRFTLHLGKAIFDITDVSLNTEAGSCEDCPKRSGNCRDLCPDIESADVCTDPDCFASKRDAHVTRMEFEGKRVISGAEADKIMPYGSSDYLYEGYCSPGRYAMASKSYGELLGDDLPEPTTIINTKGATAVAYKESELKAHLQARIDDGTIVIDKVEHQPAAPSQWEIEKAAREKRLSPEKARRLKLFNTLAAQLHKNTDELPMRMALAAAVRLFNDNNLYYSALVAIAATYGVAEEDANGFIENYINSAVHTVDLARLLCLVAVANGLLDVPWNFDAEENDDDDADPDLDLLESMAISCGIDPDAILAENAPDPSPAAQAQEEVAPEEELSPFEKIKAKALAKRNRRNKESAAADDDDGAAAAAGEAVPA